MQQRSFILLLVFVFRFTVLTSQWHEFSSEAEGCAATCVSRKNWSSPTAANSSMFRDQIVVCLQVGDADRSWMFAACADWIPKQRRWRETTVRTISLLCFSETEHQVIKVPMSCLGRACAVPGCCVHRMAVQGDCTVD